MGIRIEQSGPIASMYRIFTYIYHKLQPNVGKYTSSTAQGGGGSFKNRKRIGEIDCCE